MKNTMRCLGFIALVAVIGFVLVACDNGTTTRSGGGGSIVGTYGYTPTGNLTITFRSNNTFTGNFLSSSPVNGTYQIRGNTIVLSQRYYGYNWTIINSNTVMDGDGEYWTRR